MRQQNCLRFIGRLLVLFVAISSTGCSPWWSGWRDGKSASLQTVQDDLQYAQQKTRETRKALDELRFASEADLPRAYRAFKAEVNTMTGAGSRLVRHATAMQYEGNTYLVEAETSAGQCRYPRLSRSARMPRMELGDAFEPIAERGEQAQRAYRAFEFDILAVQEILSRNLTERGVMDLELFMRKSEADGDNLDYALQEALAAAERAKAAYDSKQAAGGTSETSGTGTPAP